MTIRHIFTLLAFITMGPLLAACAGGPEFPKTGQPSPYDGLWAGDMKDSCTTTSTTSLKGEIRYGLFIGAVRNSNTGHLGDIWGQLLENGSFDGQLGSLGVSAGWAKVQFTADGAATGSWATSRCNGEIMLKRS